MKCDDTKEQTTNEHQEIDLHIVIKKPHER
jgi:hypothetical protein